MTALDRALIKAYRAQQAGPRSSDGPVKPVSPSFEWHGAATTHSVHTAEVPTREPILSIALADSSEASSPELKLFSDEQVSFRVDVGYVGIPGARAPMPHKPVVAVPKVATAPQRMAEVVPPAPEVVPIELVAESAPAPPSTTPEPPPLVHLTSRPSSSFALDDLPLDEARPRLIVDRFSWTEICAEIRQNLGVIFEQFIGRLSASGKRGTKVVAVAGMDREAGCSSVVLCVAQELAAQGQRALILDAHCSDPSLASLLGISVRHGWDEVLGGQLALGEVLVESTEDNVVLAPLCGSIAAGTIQESITRSTLIWRMMAQSYDAILLDLGTIDSDQDVSVMRALYQANNCPGMYVVCDQRSTRPQDIVQINRRLKTADMKLLGVIENFANQSA